MSKKDRASLTAQLRGLVSDISELRSEVSEEYRRISSALTRLSVLVFTGAGIEDSLGRDWKLWAVAQCKGFGRDGADLAPPSVYRLRNAGAVAAVLGDAVADASYLALVPLYRFLAAAKTDAETETAHETIAAVWAQAVKTSRTGAPTAEAVLALVETKTKNTRGKSGRTAAQRKADQTAKNTRAKNTPTKTTETPDTETDPGARDACRKSLLRALGTYSGEAAPLVLAGMALGVKLAETHSLSVADAIIREEVKSLTAAVKTAAAKTETKTTKTLVKNSALDSGRSSR